MKTTMEEIWKNIEGFKGFYQVSNLGRIKSMSREVNFNNSTSLTGKRRLKERILKPIPDKEGYSCLHLFRNTGDFKNVKVHRIVAQAFIENPENKPQINHVNGVKNDNRFDNLEWCNNSENGLHSFRELERKPSYLGKTGILHPRSKSINQYDLSGNFIANFESTCDAERKTGICRAHIKDVAKGKRKTAGGFKWELKDSLLKQAGINRSDLPCNCVDRDYNLFNN